MDDTNLEMPQMRTTNLQSLVDFQKMVFIYNAVNDGWTVKQLLDGRYEFRKRDRTVTSDTCLDTYLRGFIKYYRELQNTNRK